MLFNSYGFIFIFFPVVFYVYFYLHDKKLIRTGKAWLTGSSFFFYAWWNPIYLPLLLFSISVNYFIGLRFAQDTNSKTRNLFLTTGIIFNLVLLGYFKYTNFFISNINSLLGSEISLVHLILPLGISFFTFSQIAYLADCYKGRSAETDFLNYALFVSFFPKMIQGPIARYEEIAPQFINPKNNGKDYTNMATALFVFAMGLFKKVFIADNLADWANHGFDTAKHLSFLAAWATSLSYTLQLYFDFSGYTDMAIGIALMFNISLPANFNSPYQAVSIQDFWRRWHITLSCFLRDYIYIPLGGNRRGKLRTYLNILVTFLLGGIWHGAGWTFIFWGILHGLALSVNRIWQNLGFKINTALSWFITFNFVNLAWVFFRAKEWKDALKVLKGMFGLTGIVLPPALQTRLAFLADSGVVFGDMFPDFNNWRHMILYLSICIPVVFLAKNSGQFKERFQPTLQTAIITAVLLSAGLLSFFHAKQFIYEYF